MDGAAVDLNIDHDQETGAKSKAIFDALLAQKDMSEGKVEATLEWQRLDTKRASRLRIPEDAEGGLQQPGSWPLAGGEDDSCDEALEQALRGTFAKVEV